MNFKNKIKVLAIPITILVVSIAISVFMFKLRDQTVRTKREPTTPSVQVITVKSQDVTPALEVFGEVRAHREVQIQAQVTGIATWINDRLIVGGNFRTGEELIRIQAIDFELAVDQREADLALARTQYEQEIGRQEIAKREWQLLEGKQTVENHLKRLALRQPQLRQAEISLKAAESALQLAQLDLDRTIIRAPFNSSILVENAEQGQLITTSGNICRMVCTDDFYIIASLPQALAKNIRTLDDHGISAKALVHTQNSDKREGTIIRFLADLELDTRMVRIVVKVKDPLALEAVNTGREKLFLGSFVKLEIQLPTVKNAIRIPRNHIRAGDTVWVSKEEMLEVRKLKISHREAEDLIITEGLIDGDKVITTSLQVATPGMRVSIKEPK